VAALRRNPNSTGHLDPAAAVRWQQGDLNDGASLERAMQGVDILLHSAAYYPRRERLKTIPQHIDAARAEMQTVIAAAKAAGVKRMVYTSALTCIGYVPPSAGRLADEGDFYKLGDIPDSAYNETKIVMEQIALEANSADFEVVVTNPTAVFGPGDIHLTLGGLLLLIAKGVFITWLPVSINVVDVRDVAAAHIEAALHGKPGERYILGGHNTTMREAMSIAARAAGKRPPFIKVPLWSVRPIVWLGDRIPSLPLPANHLRYIKLWQPYNTAKAERELGLQGRPFAETVLDALAWFKANGKL
jgi:dihydroflavonol-4-reductase